MVVSDATKLGKAETVKERQKRQKYRQDALPEIAEQAVEGVEENADDEQADRP